MRPLRGLLAALTETLGAAFELGGEGDALFHKLSQRLRALRTLARRLSVGSGILFLLCAVALGSIPFLIEARGWKSGALSLAAVAVMVISVLGALEASRLAGWIDTLEDLLSYGAPMGKLDLVQAIEARVRAEVSPEPSWEPLVGILSQAYHRTSTVEARLRVTGIPIERLHLNQPVADLWRDALRLAYRRQQLDALMAGVLSDPNVRGYHDRVRAQYARLAR